jgi:hypothetical protein
MYDSLPSVHSNRYPPLRVSRISTILSASFRARTVLLWSFLSLRSSEPQNTRILGAFLRSNSYFDLQFLHASSSDSWLCTMRSSRSIWDLSTCELMIVSSASLNGGRWSGTASSITPRLGMLNRADAALHAVNNAAEKSRKDFGEISSRRFITCARHVCTLLTHSLELFPWLCLRAMA